MSIRKAIIIGAAAWGAVALGVVLALSASAVALQTIDATGGLDQQVPVCGAGQVVNAHFIINQIDTESDAPSSITVDLVGGGTAVFPLAKTTPGVVAMYDGAAPDGVTGASAQIYVGWSGKFNLSNYFCGSGTPPTTTTTTSPGGGTTTTTTSPTAPPPPGGTTTTTTPGTPPTSTTPGGTPPGSTTPPMPSVTIPPGTPQAPQAPISGTPQVVTG